MRQCKPKQCSVCAMTFIPLGNRALTCSGECWKERNRGIGRRKYRENPNPQRERSKQWEKDNSDKVRERTRKRRKENPEMFRESSRKWAKANPDKVRESVRRHIHSRRVRVKDSGGVTAMPIVDWIAEQNGRCARCNADIQLCGHDTHHIKPVAEMGDNARENLEALCIPCHNEVHGKSVPESYYNPTKMR